jgi:hypothetical protein
MRKIRDYAAKKERKNYLRLKKKQKGGGVTYTFPAQSRKGATNTPGQCDRYFILSGRLIKELYFQNTLRCGIFA